MSELPDLGKIPPGFFNATIYPSLGRANPDVLVGPQSGVDVAIVRVGPGRVMATTCDPVFIVPEYGFERAAWFAVHILASDLATCGLQPSFLCIDLNLPPSITEQELEVLWSGVHKAASGLGMAVISGHTARYEGCNYPMVGGATVIGVGSEASYVTPTMAQAGDLVLCTKGAAIEATGLFGATFPQALAARIGPQLAAQADRLFDQMSVVEDALTAVTVGVREKGVTAMHDATECGVVGGVFELAEASGLGVRLDEDAVILRPEVQAVCALVQIDPLTAISEGTLLLTVRPHRADAVLQALAAKHIAASVIGELLPRGQGLWRVRGGQRAPLIHPQVDPFWEAFGRAMQQGL